MASVRLSRQGTIKLIREFQESAGLKETHIRGLNAIMKINEAFVRDAEAGLVYCVKAGGSRLILSELYEAHLERAADLRQNYQSWEGRQVDDVSLDHIKRYLGKHGIPVKDNSDLVTAATSLAAVFYEHFGTGKGGSLHIPVIDPVDLMESRYSHIHLKL